jgi:hypothetical protein
LNIQNELRTYFQGEGFISDTFPHKKLRKKLRSVLGPKRHDQQMDISEAISKGIATSQELYELMTGPLEAHLLMSFQLEHMVSNYSEIYRLMTPEIVDGCEIIELGCYTGSFSRWLASKHPEISVVGIDRVSWLPKCNKSEDPINLKLINCGYEEASSLVPSCNVLFGSFPIDFKDRVDEDLDIRWKNSGCEPSTLTSGVLQCLKEGLFPHHPAFHTEVTRDFFKDWLSGDNNGYVEEAFTYFDWWAQASTSAATLVVSLRIPDIFHLCAVLNGAAKCGWFFDLRKSCEVTVGDEVYPLLVFSRGSVEEDEVCGAALCEWWNNTHASQSID